MEGKSYSSFIEMILNRTTVQYFTIGWFAFWMIATPFFAAKVNSMMMMPKNRLATIYSSLLFAAVVSCFISVTIWSFRNFNFSLGFAKLCVALFLGCFLLILLINNILAGTYIQARVWAQAYSQQNHLQFRDVLDTKEFENLFKHDFRDAIDLPSGVILAHISQTTRHGGASLYMVAIIPNTNSHFSLEGYLYANIFYPTLNAIKVEDQYLFFQKNPFQDKIKVPKEWEYFSMKISETSPGFFKEYAITGNKNFFLLTTSLSKTEQGHAKIAVDATIFKETMQKFKLPLSLDIQTD